MMRGHGYVIQDDDPDQWRFKRVSTWNPEYGSGTVIKFARPRINRPLLWIAVVLLVATFAMLLYSGGKL